MENRNIFTAGIINGQYKKGTYYTPEGKTLTGIHVFTTLGRSLLPYSPPAAEYRDNPLLSPYQKQVHFRSLLKKPVGQWYSRFPQPHPVRPL